MSGIFHRDSIFDFPKKAWGKFIEDSGCFSFPERITVELTNRCNLSCFMCPRNKVKMELGDMDIEIFRKIINEASHFLPVCLVPFFRGESLLHPQFVEMIKYARERGIKPIQLATNAHFLTDEISHAIIDTEVDFVSFSVDAVSGDLYKKIRGNNDFHRVFSNILSFIERKEKKQARFPEIQISCVKTEENKEFIEKFVSFWKDKVDRARIYHVHSLDGRLGHLEEQSESGQIERKPCLKLLMDIVIYWNGDVAICNHDWQRKEFIGNVKNDTIEGIWQSENYQRVRERHINGRYSEDPVCKDCSHWKAYYTEKQMIGEVYTKTNEY